MKTFHVYARKCALFHLHQQLRMGFLFIDEIEVHFHVLCMKIWFNRLLYRVKTVAERASKAVKKVGKKFLHLHGVLNNLLKPVAVSSVRFDRPKLKIAEYPKSVVKLKKENLFYRMQFVFTRLVMGKKNVKINKKLRI